MINKIILNNIKCFESLDIDLSRLNILTGVKWFREKHSNSKSINDCAII